MATQYSSDEDPELLARGLAEVMERLLFNGRTGLTAEAAGELIRAYGPAILRAAQEREVEALLQEWSRNVGPTTETLLKSDRYLVPREGATAFLTASDVRMITQICPKKPKL
jgi:hypothetical protein